MTAHRYSDAMLARRVRAGGDQHAFAELVRQNRSNLRFLQREFAYAHDLVSADELAQEALLGYWLACQLFDRRWRVQFATFAAPFSRRRMGHLVRAARTRKARMLADAVALDQPVDARTGPDTIMETVAAAECWQPEVLAEIRHELRILSTELTQNLSIVEREALTRIMLDEHIGRRHAAATRVREKASALLGYEWARPRTRVADRRLRALALLADGHSQRDVSQRVGIAQTTVSLWARAARKAAA